jgi:excisionase family DNA binding protein
MMTQGTPKANSRTVEEYVREEGLVIIGYLQLMTRGLSMSSREHAGAAVSRGLEAMPKELNVSFLALSQLLRTLTDLTDRATQLSDVGASGPIEQDDDYVVETATGGSVMTESTRLLLTYAKAGRIGGMSRILHVYDGESWLATVSHLASVVTHARAPGVQAVAHEMTTKGDPMTEAVVSPDTRNWLDVETLAIYLDISVDTIRGWIKLREVPFHKVPDSSLIRFKRAEIDEWLTTGRVQTKKEYVESQSGDAEAA